jgi:hypothetical protein
MAKIKGWKKNFYGGQNSWITTKRPLLSIEVFKINYNIWQVINNFKVPVVKEFKKKEAALDYAYKLMRNNRG